MNGPTFTSPRSKTKKTNTPVVEAEIDPAEGAQPPNAVVHLTPEERAARGKAARAEVPRSSHAGWDAPHPAARSPVGLLQEQAKSRVQELVPIRYGRMLASPFTFYRGAADVMASDLAATPRSGLIVQACGDAHVSNFGLFGSPERELVFDINDFDETLPGPWGIEDVKRLVTSLVLAGRVNGYTAKQRRKVALATGSAYRMAIRSMAAMRDLDVWYAHSRVEQGLPGLRAMLDEREPEAGGARRGEGAHPRQPAGVRQADDDRRRRAADHQRSHRSSSRSRT